MYKITVGICCYKQKSWMHRCLRSLSGQTLPKEAFEVVVVNDDPEEDLSELCDSHRAHLNIKLINNEKNVGLPASLNKILNVSLGKYFVRIDTDDYVSKDFLYFLSTFLDMNSGSRVMNTESCYQAVACDYFKASATGKLISRHSPADEPIACGVMFTYESLCDVGFYNEKFKMREGHELTERYTQKYKIYNLPMPLYRYRVHPNNRTRNKEEVKIYDSMLR